jgi:glycosyltransferase involved in cell wall biosynthesis
MISIVMPAYNAENTILNTLNKLKCQTFTDFEVIIVNDGSTDKTQEIIEKFIDYNGSKYKIINQDNQGEGMARNIGIMNSSGEYMLFLDADDYLDNLALFKMYRELISNNYDLVFSSYTYVLSNGKNKLFTFKNYVYSREKLIELFYRRIINIGIGNTLFRKSIIIDNNILFGKYNAGADNELFRKLILYTNKAKSIDDNLFFYIQHKTSVMNSEYNMNRLSSIDSVLDTKQYIRKNNFNNNFNNFNNIFLINEVKGNALGYMLSNNVSYSLLRNNILNYLPYNISIKLFLSKDRTLWLLSLYIFYRLPILSLISVKYIYKLLKREK